MAALSSSTGSLHRDVRSESKSHKRAKDHNSKWAYGTRNSPGVWHSDIVSMVNDSREGLSGSPERQAKVRPVKRYNNRPYHVGNKVGSQECNRQGVITRTVNKADYVCEARKGPSLSHSLGDLGPLPPLEDADIIYSFDAHSAPTETVGLTTLVEKAEKEFASRETDRIVRTEYEMLDESGETVVNKGKGKRGSPKQRAEATDEDDWEEI